MRLLDSPKRSWSLALGIVLLLGFLTCLPWSAAAQSDKIPGMSLGTFKVSNNGSANYSIPIIISPGTNGLAPKLSLAFDSQSRNGPLGIGWSLVGIPSIHRCAQTLVQDNFKGGIFYDGNDRFCMDGQRLMAITPTEYRTELDTFVRVFASTQAFASSDTGTTPRSFTVKNKAGETLEFGNTNDSRIEAAGRLSIRVWALNRITDSSGNYITFTYQEDNANGDYRLLRIDYTGNSNLGVTPQRSVQFLYEPRPNTADRVMVYVGGSIVQTMMRLTTIQTYAPDPSQPAGSQPILVREYRIEYAPEQNEIFPSLITGVTECASDGSCLPANRFTWQTTQRTFDRPNWTGNDFQTATDTAKFNFIGDFNGDGKMDIASKNGANCSVHLSYGSGFSRSSWTCDLNDNGYNWVGDFDGDGKSDILVKTGNTCKLLVSNGTNFNPITGLSCNLNDTKRRWNFIGDFNGDGRIDIVSKSGSNCAVNLSNGTSFTTTTVGCFINAHDDLSLNYVGDFDGDGKSDILARIGSADGTAAGCIMNLGTGTGFASSGWECSLSHDGHNYIGDFNGDGKTDILNVNGDGPHVVSLATGTRFVFEPWDARIDLNGFNWVGDFDGDGRSDILSKNGPDCFIHYSKGNRFHKTASSGQPGNFYSDCRIDNDRHGFHYIGDFSGDGRIGSPARGKCPTG